MRYHTLVEPIIRRELYTSGDDRLTHTKQENMLGMVLESVSAASLDIVSLNLDKQWEIGIRDVYNILLDERFFPKLLASLPGLESRLRNLQTLRFKVNVAWRYMDPQEPSIARGLACFSSACSRLRIFRFEEECVGEHGDSFLEEILPLLRSERLEDLEMENSVCDSEQLCSVLRRHRSTLKRVRLQGIDLLDHGSWELVFEALGELSHLERLSIGTLTGYDNDDVWCAMTFPPLSWLRQITVSSNEIEEREDLDNGQDLAELGDVEPTHDDEADMMATPDDHQDIMDEDVEFVEEIELDRDHIATLFHALTLRLTYEAVDHRE